MSGSSFDYAYGKVSNFVDSLRRKIQRNLVKNEWGDCYDVPPETIKLLAQDATLTMHVSGLMKEIEWLYSGDTDEETYSNAHTQAWLHIQRMIKECKMPDPDLEAITDCYATFKGKGGYPDEQESARKTFKIGKNYKVQLLNVGRSSSTLSFEEVSGRWNSVMFKFDWELAPKCNDYI